MASLKSLRALHKGSPFMAAAAGAAVCLGGGAANAVNGNVAASNAGATQFDPPVVNVKLFGSLVDFDINGNSTGYITGANGGLLINRVIGGSNFYQAGPGFNVSSGTNFLGFAYLPASGSNTYIPMKFTNGGTRYGWVHCVSTTKTLLRIDTWSYNASGGAIKTLDESITPKKLALSDGRVKLNWSNANEDGVARYEVQGKGVNGAWAAVDSSAPGEGNYAATVAAGEYRLLIENSDGTSRNIRF